MDINVSDEGLLANNNCTAAHTVKYCMTRQRAFSLNRWTIFVVLVAPLPSAAAAAAAVVVLPNRKLAHTGAVRPAMKPDTPIKIKVFHTLRCTHAPHPQPQPRSWTHLWLPLIL